jgi:hypothetical protein
MTIMIAANIFDRINVLMADGLQIKSLFNGKYMRKKLAFRYNIESFTFFSYEILFTFKGKLDSTTIRG